ncbi:MAG: flagellar basal body rod protein FlgC [Sphingomonadales bacterium]|nr:flagellar basal body rod protein FlgC [Sphingomonadales bacterium]
MNAMEIARTGLDVEWRRLEVIAQNIANAQTATGPDGTGYRPMHLISGPAVSFAEVMAGGAQASEMRGVSVYSIEPQNLAARRVYEPANPQADAAGYVSYPGFDHAAEMALMVKTTRAYEANVVMLNAARQMYSNALQIGKRA